MAEDNQVIILRLLVRSMLLDNIGQFEGQKTFCIVPHRNKSTNKNMNK
jgi:hypothetical protein